MQTFQGFFEQGRFIPLEKIVIPNYKKAIVTILDEPISISPVRQKNNTVTRLLGMFEGKLSSEEFIAQKQIEKELEE